MLPVIVFVTVRLVKVPTVVILEDPAHVDNAVFSTLERPTADLSSVCQDLSPL